ncbi:sodium-dependent transporter [Prolixibacteraceae bacterium JC049]|nr:sodium-dependent transporter [Prolixibacteraceae bacterium JC049]
MSSGLGKQSRDSFGSKFGVVAAAAGSAVGLGNIWKFPYITGEFGGAAFLFVYLGFILAIGLPIMLSEFIVGRGARRNAFGSFKHLAPGTNWKLVGFLGVGAAFMIQSFYGVVAGWSMRYVELAVEDSFANRSASDIQTLFSSFIEDPVSPLYFQLAFMVLVGAIVIIGVQKGIEQFSKVLMPVLLLIIIYLDIKAVSLEGAKAGLEFLFKPDFSKLTGEGVLSALGHAFFSLSLGMGTLITYGSYIKKDNNLIRTAAQVTAADTIIALLAGVAIFPVVFAMGIEPSSGPGLVFITLPNVFHQIPGGYIFAILFFLLLVIAALTSSISILEVVVAYFSEELKIKRRVATILAVALTSVFGVMCSLSMGIYSDVKIFGYNFFDLLDHIASNILLPLGGMFIALFVGWYLKRNRVAAEINQGGSISDRLLSIFMILVKIVAPLAIGFVFVKGLL